ncbi:MAG: hypothetical protein FJZ09_06035 [Candidatus Omnitrophica bacterium]|nr:hypothetical protein [Candidatus Omnitrophota bacterium]
MAEQGKEKDDFQIKIGAKADESVNCGQCQGQFPAAQRYAYKGKKGQTVYLCEKCHEAAEKAFREETQNPNLAKAAVVGSLAALAAGVAWYLFSVLTGYQIGYVAIGVGFLIGHAVIWGSGKKRGPSLQIISAVITVVTLLVSQYFLVLFYLREYLLEHSAEFPGYNGQWLFVSPFEPDVLKAMFSPIGLIIWGVGIYFAYSLPKARSI